MYGLLSLMSDWRPPGQSDTEYDHRYKSRNDNVLVCSIIHIQYGGRQSEPLADSGAGSPAELAIPAAGSR
jgi:hypothetical protein